MLCIDEVEIFMENVDGLRGWNIQMIQNEDLNRMRYGLK